MSNNPACVYRTSDKEVIAKWIKSQETRREWLEKCFEFSGPPGLSENVSEGVSRRIRSLSDLPRLPERKTAARHEDLDADERMKP